MKTSPSESPIDDQEIWQIVSRVLFLFVTQICIALNYRLSFFLLFVRELGGSLTLFEASVFGRTRFETLVHRNRSVAYTYHIHHFCAHVGYE